MYLLHYGLGMEERLYENYFSSINVMEINKLVDLNSLRTAPQLSNSQVKKLDIYSKKVKLLINNLIKDD